MPPTQPQQARAVLPRVDPARQLSGWPIGLRDGALVALMAAGLTAHEIADLHATAITMDRGHILVTVHRHGVTWNAILPTDLGARLLAWITERRLWADPAPLFTSRRRQLSPAAIHQVLLRYRKQRRARV